MNPGKILAAAFLALALGMPLAAQESDQLTTREQIDRQLADYRQAMSISEYQWSQVEMILKSAIRERVAVARRYGLDGPGGAPTRGLSSKEKRRMRNDLEDIREATEDRMKRYLDKKQYKEFKALQKDVHERFLARAEELEEA